MTRSGPAARDRPERFVAPADQLDRSVAGPLQGMLDQPGNILFVLDDEYTRGCHAPRLRVAVFGCVTGVLIAG